MGLDMYLYAERPAPGLARVTPNEGSDHLYVSNWEHAQPAERKRFARALVLSGLDGLTTDHNPHALLFPGEPPRVQVCCAYWRKANAIHRWFVEQVQNGIDECQHTPVTREQLDELIARCRAVLDSTAMTPAPVINGYRLESNATGEMQEIPMLEDGNVLNDTQTAQALLPTTSGFFFGSTDYDDGYRDDLETTIEQVTRALEQAPADTRFIYHASW